MMDEDDIDDIDEVDLHNRSPENIDDTTDDTEEVRIEHCFQPYPLSVLWHWDDVSRRFFAQGNRVMQSFKKEISAGIRCCLNGFEIAICTSVVCRNSSNILQYNSEELFRFIRRSVTQHEVKIMILDFKESEADQWNRLIGREAVVPSSEQLQRAAEYAYSQKRPGSMFLVRVFVVSEGESQQVCQGGVLQLAIIEDLNFDDALKRIKPKNGFEPFIYLAQEYEGVIHPSDYYASMVKWPSEIKMNYEFPACVMQGVKHRPPDAITNEQIKTNLEKIASASPFMLIDYIRTIELPLTPVETMPARLLLQRVRPNSYSSYAPNEYVVGSSNEIGNCFFESLSWLFSGDFDFAHQFRLGAFLTGARNIKAVNDYVQAFPADSDERMMELLAGARRLYERRDRHDSRLPLPMLILDEILQTAKDKNPSGFLQAVLAASYLGRPIVIHCYVVEEYFVKYIRREVTPMPLPSDENGIPLELSLIMKAGFPEGHFVPLVLRDQQLVSMRAVPVHGR